MRPPRTRVIAALALVLVTMPGVAAAQDAPAPSPSASPSASPGLNIPPELLALVTSLFGSITAPFAAAFLEIAKGLDPAVWLSPTATAPALPQPLKKGLPPLPTPSQLPAVSSVTSALNGSRSDPKDSGGPLDVKELRHSTTSTELTLEAEMFGDFKSEQVSAVDWLFDFNNDGRGDGCIDTFWDGTKLRAEVFGNNCGGNSLDHGTATHPSARLLKVVVPLSALRRAGLASATFKYAVKTASAANGTLAQDSVPDDTSPVIPVDVGVLDPSVLAVPVGSVGTQTNSPAGSGAQAAAPSATSAAKPATTGNQASVPASGAAGAIPKNGAPIQQLALIGTLLLLAGSALTGLDRRMRPALAVEMPMQATPVPASAALAVLVPAFRLALPPSRGTLALPA